MLFATSSLTAGSRLQHAAAELAARAEVATLDQQLAQQQLDVMLVQLKAGTGQPQARR